MKETFKELGLNEQLIKALNELGIKEPTEIQKQAISLAMEEKNIIGQSETGTGKTLAFLLPIIEKVDASKKEMQAIILTPTHELAVQINNTIVELRQKGELGVTSTTLIGSANITRQIDKLKTKPHILVGSAGRVLELIKKKKVTAHTIKTLVIDEGDKLLDENNIKSVMDIIKSLKREAQLMVFSATLTGDTLKTVQGFMGEAEVIRVKGLNKVNENIDHNFFFVEHREKIDMLRKLIHASKPKKALVFINNSYDVNMTLSKLKFHKIKAEALHGSDKKADRQNALHSFRTGKIQVLVASDIAARGLDIKGITHVINLDIPEEPKDYLHRAGRVGRAGNKGICYSLVDLKEIPRIKRIESCFDIKIEQRFIYKGRIIDGEE